LPGDAKDVARAAQRQLKNAPTRIAAATKYDGMDKQRLQGELRKILRELIEVERQARAASRKARDTETAYNSAPDNDKADALFRMLEAEVASRAPMEQYKKARIALDAAKQAYIRRVVAESR
jgi:hypothetical protein